MAGTSGSRSVDSRDNPCTRVSVQAGKSGKLHTWKNTAFGNSQLVHLQLDLDIVPKVLPALQHGQKGGHSPLEKLLEKLFSGPSLKG